MFEVVNFFFYYIIRNAIDDIDINLFHLKSQVLFF